MNMIVVQMSLADRDKHIMRIEEQIEAKRNLLLEKQKKMNVLAKQNGKNCIRFLLKVNCL